MENKSANNRADHWVNLVFFAAGGLTFAVESARVQALDAVGECAAPALSALLHLPAVTGGSPPQEWLLRLAHPQGTLAVRVEEPIMQDRLFIADLHPLPPLLAARLTLPAVRALARWRTSNGETLAIILDPARFPDGVMHS
jgi:hypothetical protein